MQKALERHGYRNRHRGRRCREGVRLAKADAPRILIFMDIVNARCEWLSKQRARW